MKRKITFGMMAAAALLAFGACSQELETVRNDAAEAEVRVSFGAVATRAVGEEVSEETDKATANEKAVSSLYAVVFKDVSETGKTSATVSKGTAADNDSYVKAIELLSDNLNKDVSVFAENAEYKFKLGTGNYQFCFIANPGDGLLAKIKAVKTVGEFKALVVDEDPATKPMLMTSDYFGGTVSSDGLDLTDETVLLTRAMARIDIVNKASGVSISSVVLKNRANKSTLETSKGNTSFENKTYDASTSLSTEDAPYSGALPLAGDAVADASSRYPEYDKVIYSYEQLNTEENLPSLEITYTIAGSDEPVTKEIAFQATTGEKFVLKRNYLYTVNVSNSTGKLRFILTVADWNEGETFGFPSEELADMIDFDEDKYKVGSFLLSDGTFATASEVKALVTGANYNKESDAKPIGIVAYRFTNGDKSREGYKSLKEQLAKKGVYAPHGLVVALKNAAVDVHWAASGNITSAVNDTKGSLSAVYVEGKDGYTLTEGVMAKIGNSGVYPTFDAVKTFRSSDDTKIPTAVAEKVTDWYLPSMGEWISIYGDRGLAGLDVSKVIACSGSEYKMADHIYSSFTDTIDKFFTEAGLKKISSTEESGDFDGLTDASGCYWSSSEYNANRAYAMCFYSQHTLFGWANKYLSDGAANRKVRCILAF